MTIKKPESDRAEISSGNFEPVEPGDYIWQIGDGNRGIELKLSKNEESGWRGLNFPVQVVQVVQGDEEAVDRRGSFSFTVMNNHDEPNQFIDETMGYILGYTDLLDKFVSKYGEEIDYTSQEFVDDLNVKLTGKLIGIIHYNKTKGDYTNMQVGTWYKYGSDQPEVLDTEQSAKKDESNAGW